MKYTKAGECLSYGIGNELIESGDRKDGEKPNYNLKAFVTYFTLMGDLSKTTAKGICTILSERDSNLTQLKNHFSHISKLIIGDLKRYYLFSDFEQLLNQLNEKEIPDWVFATNGELLKLFPQVYLVNDTIYYMKRKDGRYYFCCVHISQVEEIMEYSQDFFQYFGTDNMWYDEINHTISNKYSEILGFNAAKQTFYLRPRHTNMMYAEYHADTKQEIILHHNCIGIIGNTMPVIKEDNQLCLIVGKDIKPIKKIDILEDYRVKNDCIYVYPASGMPAMFRPYILSPDGERIEISHKEAISFVLENMKSDIYDFRGLFFNFSEGEITSSSDNDVTVFSLDYADRLFLERFDLEENEVARIYHFIVKLLKSYLPFDRDVLDYFYMLADVSKRMSKEGDLRFIGEGIYWRLNELHLTGKLSSIIKDIDKLKNKLMQDVYWDDETIMEEKGSKYIGAYLGFFSIDNEKILAETVTVDKAVCIGDILLAPWKDSPGIVTLNLWTGAYEIQYQRELDRAEVQMVLEAFHIIDIAYRVSVDQCNT